MKKWILAVIIVLFTLSGCAGIQNNADPDDLAAEYGPEHPLDYISDTDNTNSDANSKGNRYGYSRNRADDPNTDEKMTMHDVIDRQRISNGISNLLVQSPEVQEAGVLITNEYALVAFRPKNKEDDDVAKHVKMITESIVPYYYVTVVTDRVQMIEDLEAFKGMDARSKGGHSSLKQLVNDMRSATKQPKTEKRKADETHM
ncbi:Sporulation lipoprotein YhcN/YlaJ (Spore_YhcN_YlaJ) [Alteribacillus persepolensis]|uniref:Sporulation lipoprotein YhcN/YlaJ (Spore_YhcN_YlaJ) n=1 Tax=Alteribacillus persepolensis TaxID=568899 RepID=A0A1G8DX68_9BACI|nr:YhcN/YlaJ family sporulation lipoprotein [Alteribacillus persepolensis]SDH62165.1 Sporulation lipoprotein YhcN/YlaJ (Spore_YhcN_YlaJ) [Alteribacillus persepolensis]